MQWWSDGGLKIIGVIYTVVEHIGEEFFLSYVISKSVNENNGVSDYRTLDLSNFMSEKLSRFATALIYGPYICIPNSGFYKFRLNFKPIIMPNFFKQF